MQHERQVYLLDDRKLSPETIAVTFAKTSRSPESFKDIAEELTEAKSAEFNEKWVVGYGHSSVAEHAVLHIALENVSRLAIETIEGNRLASYTEKSSRYQKWREDYFYTPVELTNHPLLDLYTQTCTCLFQFYLKALEATRKVISDEYPQNEGEKASAWEQRIRAKYADACRFILPAAAMANVGVTINARSLEHALCKMLSHPLDEVRQIGNDIHKAAQSIVPTLVKYVCPKPYLSDIEKEFTKYGKLVPSQPQMLSSDWCRLVHHDPENDDNILASAIYRYGAVSFDEAFLHIKSLSEEQRIELADVLFSSLGKYDEPVREVEYSSYLFDIVMDQGAYFEFKRHRMMTQTPQELTANLGYAVPSLIRKAGIEEAYHEVMKTAQMTYNKLVEVNPHLAAYIVPNAFNRRVLMAANLRSIHHLIDLRTSPNAHFSIRRIVHRMADEIMKASPLFGRYLRIGSEETWQEVEKIYFTQTK